jgi:uncharacterized protein YggU (UPF0235/DUF167 family)
MARPRSELPSPDEIRRLADGEGRLALRVTPGARSEAVEIGEGVLLVKTRAKPKDGVANDAVLKLVAKALSIGATQLTLLHGQTGRDKLVQLPKF